MWCTNCQSEVAAEVTSDNSRIHCASCGAEISASKTLRPVPKTREARDLLERWSSEQLLDPYGPLPGIHAESASSHHVAEQPVETPAPSVGGSETDGSTKSTFRMDPPHPTGPSGETPGLRASSAERSFPNAPEAESSTGVMSREPVLPVGPPGTRIDAAHGSPVRPPHFDVRSAIVANEKPRKINWATVSGQLLAYLGVLGLTVGTSMVLLGHFRGPESQTATGWLITTAGQMLLFLGVVTLVSGGMEQTADEVARRIDRLGEQIVHIERSATPPHQRSSEPAPSDSEASVSVGTDQPATKAK